MNQDIETNFLLISFLMDEKDGDAILGKVNELIEEMDA